MVPTKQGGGRVVRVAVGWCPPSRVAVGWCPQSRVAVGWCPYCNMHLSELRHVIPQLRESGFDVLFLSNDRPDQLYSSLKMETQEDIDGLDYVILSDADINAAKALGTAFIIPDRVTEYLDEKGRDYKDSSMTKYRALAVPAVFVIGTSGEISFAYANPDYKVRLPADELMQAADELVANNAE